MSNGDDSGALSRSAGFVSGFASSFNSGLAGAAKARDEERDRQEKRAMWEAHNDLLRELNSSKDMTGQELIDYGRSLGVDPSQLQAFDPSKSYDGGAGKAWIGRVADLMKTDKTEKGKGDRGAAANATRIAAAKIKAAGGGGAKKPMDLGRMEHQALLSARALAGIPDGVAPGDPGLPKEKQDAFNQYYMQSLQGQKTAWENTMDKSSGVDPNKPFESVTDPGIMRDNKITPGNLYNVRSGAMPHVAPAPGAVPGPGAAPAARGVGPPAAKKPLTLDQLPAM